MEEVNFGPVALAWDPAARFAVIRSAPLDQGLPEQVHALIAALSQHVGVLGRPWGLLCEGRQQAENDPQDRAAWADLFRLHRKEARVAFFNMSPVSIVAAEMFRIGSGMQMRSFATESNARAWLRKQGYPA